MLIRPILDGVCGRHMNYGIRKNYNRYDGGLCPLNRKGDTFLKGTLILT